MFGFDFVIKFAPNIYIKYIDIIIKIIVNIPPIVVCFFNEIPL